MLQFLLTWGVYSIENFGYHNLTIAANSSFDIMMPDYSEFVAIDWDLSLHIVVTDEKAIFNTPLGISKAFTLEAQTIIVKNPTNNIIFVTYWIIPIELCQDLIIKINSLYDNYAKITTKSVAKLCLIPSPLNSNARVNLRAENASESGNIKIYTKDGRFISDFASKNLTVSLISPLVFVVRPKDYNHFGLNIAVSVNGTSENSESSSFLSAVPSMSPSGARHHPYFEVTGSEHQNTISVESGVILALIVGSTTLAAIVCFFILWKGWREQNDLDKYSSVDTDQLVPEFQEDEKKETLEFSVVMDEEV